MKLYLLGAPNPGDVCPVRNKALLPHRFVGDALHPSPELVWGDQQYIGESRPNRTDRQGDDDDADKSQHHGIDV